MNSSDRVWRERGLRSAVLAGDERAWQTWYEECFEGLAAYVAWRCAGLRDLRDEIVQETWLTAVRRIRRFDPDRASFAAWLCGIAANLLRNHFRSQVRHGKQVQTLDGQAPDLPVAEPGGDCQDLAERVASALAALPEHYEAVLRAKYLDHESVAQIADCRHESAKAVESLLTRAREAFREAYGKAECDTNA